MFCNQKEKRDEENRNQDQLIDGADHVLSMSPALHFEIVKVYIHLIKRNSGF